MRQGLRERLGGGEVAAGERVLAAAGSAGEVGCRAERNPLVLDTFAGKKPLVEVVLDGAHLGHKVGEVYQRQQPAASEDELGGRGFQRDKLFHICTRHEAAAHRFSQLVQNEHVDRRVSSRPAALT